MKDRFLLGFTGGLVGAIIMGALDLALNLLPAVNTKLLIGVSSMFVSKSLIGTVQGNIIGIISSLLYGSMGGILILLILENTGYDKHIYKGILLGLITWFLTCGILDQSLTLRIQDKFTDIVMLILIHIAYGITTVWFIRRYRHKVESKKFA